MYFTSLINVDSQRLSIDIQYVRPPKSKMRLQHIHLSLSLLRLLYPTVIFHFLNVAEKKEGLQNLTVKCFWFTASIVVKDVTISAPKCGQFRKAANLPIYNRCYLSRMRPPFWHVTRWNYQINERLTHPTGFSRTVRIFRVSADASFASIPH